MILASAMLVLAAQAAPATGTSHQWRPLGEPRPGFSLFYDPNPSVRAGDTVTVRLLTRFPPVENGPAYTLSMAEIRCGPGEARVIRTLGYDSNGTQIRDDDVPVAFETIPEGSLFNTVRRAVC